MFSLFTSKALGWNWQRSMYKVNISIQWWWKHVNIIQLPLSHYCRSKDKAPVWPQTNTPNSWSDTAHHFKCMHVQIRNATSGCSFLTTAQPFMLVYQTYWSANWLASIFPIHLPLDQQSSHWPTPDGETWSSFVLHLYTQHRLATGMCAEPPYLLPLHPQL